MLTEQQSLHAAVRTLTTNSMIQVAFALDQDGSLIAWSGRSPAFSPTGQFASVDKDKEPDHNLYLTLVGDYYIGVLFADGVPVENVRQLVEDQEEELAPVLEPAGAADDDDDD